jgi:SHS2 domain-containing protein
MQDYFLFMKYEFLPHTADVKFRAYGSTMAEAFSNAALALKEVITEDKVKGKVKKTISVESEDEKALLYDFLEQFLILLDSEDFLLGSVEELNIKKDKKFKLNAVVKGDTDLKKYKTETHIKAVTYQEMEIKKEKGKYMLQVILDL